MPEKLTLYVCHLDEGGPNRHPCRRAHRALKESGHRYDRVVFGRNHPFGLFTNGRRPELKKLSGQEKLPVLGLPNGTTIVGSQKIVDWAKTNDPAPVGGSAHGAAPGHDEVSTKASEVKPLTPGVRSPVVAPVTRFLLGLPLFLLSTQTSRYFAWTIAVPLTAAFLGACYWSGALLALLASRRSSWAQGRVSISVALVFAPLITLATAIHLDLFHLDSAYGWIWVTAYAIYPVMLGYFFARQLRAPGGDPPPSEPLASGLRVLLGLHAVILIPLGIGLFVAPHGVGQIWPWPLTALTAQVIGAWVLAIGVLAGHALLENDLDRVQIALQTFPVLGTLAAIALVRYPDDLRWGEPGAWIFVTMLASALVIGAYGQLALHRYRARLSPSGVENSEELDGR